MNNNKMRILLIIQVVSLILTILVVGGLLFFLFEHNGNAPRLKLVEDRSSYIESETLLNQKRIEALESSVRQSLQEIKLTPGPKGDDGTNGTNGTDGVNGINGEKGDKGDNAFIEVRCNTTKNRWEVRYGLEDKWQILNGNPVKCTIAIGE